MNNTYFIDEYTIQDNEAINQFFYLNQSPYHRRYQAYNEEEHKGDSHEKLYKLEKKL